MELLRESYRTYDFVINELSDPRTNHLPLIGSPLYVILIAVTYNYFVQNLGPMLMEKRKPFDLKNWMILYNIIQILCNAFIVFKAFQLVWIPMRYSLICEPVDYSNDPINTEIAYTTYFFFLTKIVDLLDTIFMVLRKKDKQISFLHTYHHTGMIFATWIGAKYMAGGHSIFFGTVNAFVHTVMYSYYLLTAINPKFRKSIGLKKRITELQLIQFVATTVHALSGVVSNCGYSIIVLLFFIPQDIFMFALFWDFYKKTYLYKARQKANAKVKGS